jgi:hypothetical protein
MTVSNNSIEQMRSNLLKNHVSDFLQSLQNEEDSDSERTALKAVLSEGIDRLCKLDAKGLNGYFGEEVEEVCPGCLVHQTLLVSSAKQMASNFNEYLKVDAADHV